MIIVKVPNNYNLERNYILTVLLRDFLGLEFNMIISTNTNVIFTNEDNKELVLPDCLFNLPLEQWLSINSLPKQPLKLWNLKETPFKSLTTNSQLPIIYGLDPSQKNFFLMDHNKIYLGLDIFGSAFFMLTRYEEVVKNNLDKHNRFSAKESIAYQEGFIERPIINEYLEILWCCLKYLWPNLIRKKRNYRIFLSHDVDRPFTIPLKVSRVAKDVVKNILKGKLDDARNETQKRVAVTFRNNEDPFYTFNYLMNISETFSIQSSFYFITDKNYEYYSLKNSAIKELLTKIFRRGHEIGLHTSYDSYLNFEKVRSEFNKLQDVCQNLQISQDYWGGRQHYLRWKSPDTWQIWNDCGLTYDSTVGFADHIGFRCGICYEFPVFNLKTRTILKLRERPLIIMDGTLSSYMNLSWRESYQRILNLATICKKYDGDFAILWHNSSLVTDEDKKWYNFIIESIVKVN